MKRFKAILGLVTLLVFCLFSGIFAPGKAGAAVPQLINFQGVLRQSNGNPVADNSYSVTFTIYDAAAGGNVIWTETQSLTTSNGLFSALLGSVNPVSQMVFNDPLRWLGITISPDPEMTPRQQLVTVPYAFVVGQTASSDAWSLTGNSGTTAGTNFLGTTDNQPLELKANGSRAFRIEPQDTSPNLIGGAPANNVTEGVEGATIAGGGNFIGNLPNRVTDYYGTVGGGSANIAGDGFVVDDHPFATVGGGLANNASGAGSTVAGGSGNLASGTEASIGGGASNRARGRWSTVAGGGGAPVTDSNSASGDWSAVGGGSQNTASGAFATVSGGLNNKALGIGSFIGGGGGNVAPIENISIGRDNLNSVAGNSALGDWSTVSGGSQNIASGGFATVSGGGGAAAADGNTAGGINSTVGGGRSNAAAGLEATVGGGRNNRAPAANATVGGGGGALAADGNNASGVNSVVGGGRSNLASGLEAAVGGGRNNAAPGANAFVGGGGGPAAADGNNASGVNSGIAGGRSNLAGGDNSTVSGGRGNKATDHFGTVGGGDANWAGDDAGTPADQQYATVGGGNTNRALRSTSTIAGGNFNTARGAAAAIGGGDMNSVTDQFGTIAGGQGNLAGDAVGTEADRTHATVGGGSSNSAKGAYSTVPGGRNNLADKDYSLAAGRRAKAIHEGAFVWADAQDADFSSDVINQFKVRAQEGMKVEKSGNSRPAVWGFNSGTGNGGRFEVDNAANDSAAVSALTKGTGQTATGVYGVALAQSGKTAGVWGFSYSDNREAAGVRAQGDGIAAAGVPQAAALEINNGAIRVSGSQRPSGTIDVPLPTTPINSCNRFCPDFCDHSHGVGLRTDVMLTNDLIVAGGAGVGSMILLTVETANVPDSVSYYAQVHSKAAGSALVRVTQVGFNDPSVCSPASAIIRVHYLIINP